MRKLYLVPDADGYSSADGEETVGTRLQGGAGRYRRDQLGATKSVNVTWTMNPEQYAYWRAFYATVTASGSLAFLCDLLSEDGNGPTEQICNFVPGSINMPSQRGLTYVQTAQLEVRPLPRDIDYDNSIISLYESTDGMGGDVLFSIDHLVNVVAPENIGG